MGLRSSNKIDNKVYLTRVLTVLPFFSVGMFSIGCIDKHLYPVGGAQTDETDNFTTSDTENKPLYDSEFDPSKIVRVPVVLPNPQAGQSNDYFVYEQSNSLGLQGQWFGSAEDDSLIEISNAGDGTVCAQGTVAGVPQGDWSSVVLGFLLCFSDGDDSPAWKVYTLAECPFVQNLQQRLVGASFTMSGEAPTDKLEFHAKELDENNPPYIPIVAGAKDYYFSDLLLRGDRPPLNPNRLSALQFNISNLDSEAVPFHFCIEHLELLLAPE